MFISKVDEKNNAENTAIVESTTTDTVEIIEPKTSTYRLPTTIILVTLGEILTIESEIAKAKTNILQLLHNVS